MSCREVRYSTYKDRATGIVYTLENTDDVQTLVGENVIVRNENPSWREQVAAGADATTNYSRSEWLVTQPPITSASGTDTPPGYHRDCNGFWIHTGVNISPFTGDDTLLRDSALCKFRNRIQSHYGSKETMAPLAELKELRSGIRGLTGLTTDFLHDLLTIRRTKGRNALKYASNAWLNFNFGVSPLVAEIAGTIQAVENFLNRTDHSFRVSSNAETNWVSTSKELNGAAMLSAGLDTYANIKHTLSYRYAGGFHSLVESGNNYGIADHFGLSWRELIPTYWELIPYSWAVDYFTNIGAYLSDTFQLPPGSLGFCYLNRKYTMEAQLYTKMSTYSGDRYATSGHNCKHGRFVYYSFSRTKIASLPYPSLRFKTADEIGFNGVKRLLNLAAVLASGRLR